MFRYTSTEDLAAIDQYRDDPRLVQIANDITQTQWTRFLDTYRAIPEEAHFLLLAAYRYINTPQLSAYQLADAFYFLSVAIDDPDYKVANHGNPPAIRANAAPLNAEANNCLNLPQFKNSDDYGVTTFMVHNRDKVDFYLLEPTASLERCLYPEGNRKLTITVGLPTLKQDIEAIFEGQNLYSLLMPYSKSKHSVQYLHGVPLKNGSVWAARYSALPLASRQQLIKQYGPQFGHAFKQMILALQAILEARPPIKSTLIEEGFWHAHLSKDADADDLASRIIEELIIRYLNDEIIHCLLNPELNVLQEQLIKDVNLTLKHITFAHHTHKHKNNVFDDTNESIKNEAMKIALNLIEPALSNILTTAQSALAINVAARKYAPLIMAQLKTFQQQYPEFQEDLSENSDFEHRLRELIRQAIKFDVIKVADDPKSQPDAVTLPLRKNTKGKEVLNLLRTDEDIHALPSTEMDSGIQMLATILHMLENEKARKTFLGDASHRTEHPMNAGLLCTLSLKVGNMLGPHTQDKPYDAESYAKLNNLSFTHKTSTKDIIYWQTRIFILLKLLPPFNKSGEEKFEKQFEREPTLFHFAVKENKAKSLQRAIRNQQDVNARMDAGQTALWLALVLGRIGQALNLLKIPGINIHLVPDKPKLLPTTEQQRCRSYSPMSLAILWQNQLLKEAPPNSALIDELKQVTKLLAEKKAAI